MVRIHAAFVAIVAMIGLSATTFTSPVRAATSTLLRLGDQSDAVLQLQSQLAILGYLPENVTLSASGQTLGSIQFAPRYAHMPVALSRLWQPGVYNVMTEGAVMTFQEENHLSVDGIAGPQVYRALASDLKSHQQNQYGYSYVEVTETVPETLRVWHDGNIVMRSLTNTGVSGAVTDVGTWPVYLRYQSQTMSGVTPWGVHYSDPGVPYVSYFHGGDAIHGFVRSRYGYPQSLGCVELPISESARAWSWMHYGTLVTVEP